MFLSRRNDGIPPVLDPRSLKLRKESLLSLNNEVVGYGMFSRIVRVVVPWLDLKPSSRQAEAAALEARPCQTPRLGDGFGFGLRIGKP
jgi:hypothetical protein